MRERLKQAEGEAEAARKEHADLKGRTEWMNGQIDILSQELQRQREKETGWYNH